MVLRGNLWEKPRTVQCDFLGFPSKISLPVVGLGSSFPGPLADSYRLSRVEWGGHSLPGMCSGSWPSEICPARGPLTWIDYQPENPKVAGSIVVGSIPSQGTCLGCRPGPQLGA